jgi:acyl-CoA-binding protein
MTTRYLGHDIERRPAVKELLVMDSLFAQPHEEDGSNTLCGIIKICKQMLDTWQGLRCPILESTLVVGKSNLGI